LFDSGSWYTSDGNPDLLSSNVADIKLQPSSTPAPILGFHGYLLTGKLQSPKLWSAEKVRNFIHIFSCFGGFYSLISKLTVTLLLKKMLK